ncbi:MAG: YggS family pyridoxal phosphate-dependent enzyme [Deltaproteobacteria bacterium]|nr:YggS family pyridoxal phosphate-dependent enzyme [Deltaproteobacteria bacterium]
MVPATIVTNLKQIQKLIPPNVTLIGVSKKQTPEKIEEAYKAGLRHFGENTVQEFEKKYESPLPLGAPHQGRRDKMDKIFWHFIGHLQKNKVKKIIGKIDYLHSLDSVELAKEIDKKLGSGVVLKCFVQVNISKEPSKHGVFPEDLCWFLNQLYQFPHITIQGLMCIPPYYENPENVRRHFKDMKKLAQKFGLKDLSMGMSHDYKIAIEEGATYIRIGEALFGIRQK